MTDDREDDEDVVALDTYRDTVGQRSRDARHDQHALDPEDLQRLWAPWRYGYIADGAPLEGCPFCVLPERDQDRESLIVHRGDEAFVICNAYPYNPGHLMVVPYEHIAELEELSEPVAQEVWQLARRAVRVLKQRLACEGVNLGVNLGHAGGAGITEHVHLHVVPRWVGDTNFIATVGSARVLPRALEEMYDQLADGFA